MAAGSSPSPRSTRTSGWPSVRERVLTEARSADSLKRPMPALSRLAGLRQALARLALVLQASLEVLDGGAQVGGLAFPFLQVPLETFDPAQGVAQGIVLAGGQRRGLLSQGHRLVGPTFEKMVAVRDLPVLAAQLALQTRELPLLAFPAAPAPAQLLLEAPDPLLELALLPLHRLDVPGAGLPHRRGLRRRPAVRR